MAKPISIHAIPRYATEVDFDGIVFSDVAFPNPPVLTAVHELPTKQLEAVRMLLQENLQT